MKNGILFLCLTAIVSCKETQKKLIKDYDKQERRKSKDRTTETGRKGASLHTLWTAHPTHNEGKNPGNCK